MLSSIFLATLLLGTTSAGLATPSRFRSLTPRAAPYATTANELTNGTACKSVTMIYARGTTQNGNIGDADNVGPVMMNALAANIGADKLAVQGVDYDADITGFLSNLIGVDEEGAQRMADLVALANKNCPKTKIVVAGYSQGGQVIHDAANIFAQNKAAVAQIAAVMIFGDPNDGDAVGTVPKEKVTVICHDGDKICDGSLIVTPDHLNYQDDAKAAADIIAAKVQ